MLLYEAIEPSRLFFHVHEIETHVGNLLYLFHKQSNHIAKYSLCLYASTGSRSKFIPVKAGNGMAINSMKKIAVCHGKSCGPGGAARIMHALREEYEKRGIPVTERGCCGRCERHNTIVIEEDDGTEMRVSDLSPSSIKEQFIDREEDAIAKAREEEKAALEKLDDVLNRDVI